MKTLYIQGSTKEKILSSIDQYDKFRFSVASKLFGGNVTGLKVEGTDFGVFVTAVQSYAKPSTAGWQQIERNVYGPDYGTDEGKALIRSLSELQADVLYDVLLEHGVKISHMCDHTFREEFLVIETHNVDWVGEKPENVMDYSS